MDWRAVHHSVHCARNRQHFPCQLGDHFLHYLHVSIVFFVGRGYCVTFAACVSFV